MGRRDRDAGIIVALAVVVVALLVITVVEIVAVR